MTDTDLLTWLSSNAVTTKWDHRTGWTVQAFGRVEGVAPTFREALERAIAHQCYLAGETKMMFLPKPRAGVDLFAPTLINETA